MSAPEDKNLALQNEVEILQEELVKAQKEHKKELRELEKSLVGQSGAKKQLKEREKALKEEELKIEKQIREKRNEARKITL
jgi:hypothetical protein